MERTLCVWFPDWALRRSSAPPGRPAQAIDGGNRIVAVNDAAYAAGIVTGMQRREAEAICPTVATFQHDPGADWAAFEPVVEAVESVVPRVEVAEPGLLFVPVGGAVRFHGGEEATTERIAKALEVAAGVGARLGLAAGPFASRMAAEKATTGPLIVSDDDAFLASLDVSSVAADDLVATFRWLGVTTLAELARLPRAAVFSRFGQPGLEAHRLAAGEDRPPRPRKIPADPSVEEIYHPPLESLDRAAFAAKALANRLITAGGLPHRVEVEAESASGAIRHRVWRSNDPFDGVSLGDRVWWQLRAWVENGGIPGGLARLRLVPADVSDTGRQLALGQNAASEAEAARSFVRVQALAGPDSVLLSRPQGGRGPGDMVQWYRWGEEAVAPRRDPEAPWPGRLPAPSPAMVPSEPLGVDIEWDAGSPTRVRLGSRWEPVLSWAGPWRQTGRWWEGDSPSDRYQLVTSAGAFLVETSPDRAALIGVYD